MLCGDPRGSPDRARIIRTTGATGKLRILLRGKRNGSIDFAQ